MKEKIVSIRRFSELAGFSYVTFMRYCQNYQVSRWFHEYGQKAEFTFCKASVKAFRRLLRNMDSGALKDRKQKFEDGLKKLEMMELLNES